MNKLMTHMADPKYCTSESINSLVQHPACPLAVLTVYRKENHYHSLVPCFIEGRQHDYIVAISPHRFICHSWMFGIPGITIDTVRQYIRQAKLHLRGIPFTNGWITFAPRFRERQVWLRVSDIISYRTEYDLVTHITYTFGTLSLVDYHIELDVRTLGRLLVKNLAMIYVFMPQLLENEEFIRRNPLIMRKHRKNCKHQDLLKDLKQHITHLSLVYQMMINDGYLI